MSIRGLMTFLGNERSVFFNRVLQALL